MRPEAYERDPRAIYARSFDIIRAEAPLDRLPQDIAEIAVRIVHACGMVDVAGDLVFSDSVARAARAALGAGAPIYCDAQMVASGVIARALPAANPVLVTLSDARVADLAKRHGTTRSAAAVMLWRDRLDGAVAVIGNAPTALFQLLDLVETGARPAAILGFPVGFVGAAESKAALVKRANGTPFLTLPGRRGGSAMAAAAVNALTLGLGGDGT
ncbi:MAG: precorrin-8X methylmutase [Pseudomonadota bacterium]